MVFEKGGAGASESGLNNSAAGARARIVAEYPNNSLQQANRFTPGVSQIGYASVDRLVLLLNLFLATIPLTDFLFVATGRELFDQLHFMSGK
jgi:hypothetical protein